MTMVQSSLSICTGKKKRNVLPRSKLLVQVTTLRENNKILAKAVAEKALRICELENTGLSYENLKLESRESVKSLYEFVVHLETCMKSAVSDLAALINRFSGVLSTTKQEKDRVEHLSSLIDNSNIPTSPIELYSLRGRAVVTEKSNPKRQDSRKGHRIRSHPMNFRQSVCILEPVDEQTDVDLDKNDGKESTRIKTEKVSNDKHEKMHKVEGCNHAGNHNRRPENFARCLSNYGKDDPDKKDSASLENYGENKVKTDAIAEKEDGSCHEPIPEPPALFANEEVCRQNLGNTTDAKSAFTLKSEKCQEKETHTEVIDGELGNSGYSTDCPAHKFGSQSKDLETIAKTEFVPAKIENTVLNMFDDRILSGDGGGDTKEENVTFEATSKQDVLGSQNNIENGVTPTVEYSKTECKVRECPRSNSHVEAPRLRARKSINYSETRAKPSRGRGVDSRIDGRCGGNHNIRSNNDIENIENKGKYGIKFATEKYQRKWKKGSSSPLSEHHIKSNSSGNLSSIKKELSPKNTERSIKIERHSFSTNSVNSKEPPSKKHVFIKRCYKPSINNLLRQNNEKLSEPVKNYVTITLPSDIKPFSEYVHERDANKD